MRYYLLRESSPFEDSPFTMEKFKEAYNAHLANGLGNLVSRVMKMAADGNVHPSFPSKEEIMDHPQIGIKDVFEEYSRSRNANKALADAWSIVDNLNHLIDTTKPFNLLKNDISKAKEIIGLALVQLWYFTILIEPFMPKTSLLISDVVKKGTSVEKPIFPRIS